MKKPRTAVRQNRSVRCAIYTRKSSEEGLEQEFNSLQAQREACEAFIDSQRHEGWVGLRAAYDDGGFSGATMDRPALQQLLADELQQRAHGGPSRALQRRLRILAGEFEKGAGSFDPGTGLKTGASLVRRWRGHTHIVLVGEDGFEYDGQRYRSLTVIAERITGAHWSGPRFFGVSKRARAS